MRDRKRLQKIVDLETRRSVHINLTRVTHSGFRKALLDYGLSMQKAFEHFASLVAEDDSRATSIVEEAYKNKRDSIINKVSEKEADNLYDAISHQDPFEER